MSEWEEQYWSEDDINDDDYDADEVYIAEDELCDCWRYHFSHCYNIGCLGKPARYWDWDEDEDTDESDDGDEREEATPSSDSSDIPF